MFSEPWCLVATIDNAVVEGRDAIIHNGCELFLPVHERYIPLHDQMLLPPGMEVNYLARAERELPAAGTVLQMANENYFHFTAEILPRLLLLNSTLPPSVPLLVPDKGFVQQVPCVI